ncbi:MAG TPA: substrate-binding domain-containing protein [Bryobacteraceae bacterium]|nr:substrate-binding domain-containing protein [Bryobacteraceae bacterium]
MPIRTNLGGIRKERKLGMTELARITGLNRQTLHAIEAGAYTPNTSVALLLARALNTSVERLFSIEEDAPASQYIASETITPQPAPNGTPVRLAQVDGKTISVPSVAEGFFFGPADGIFDAQHGTLVIDEVQWDRQLLIAGCDPAASLLGKHAARTGVILLPWHSNSSAALDLLRAGKVHVAGCHLRNYPHPADAVVFALANWQEGLVVAPGNPKGLRTVSDLANHNASVSNREPGSGSRNLLDHELDRAGIEPERILGYGHVASAHLAAAQRVLTGDADCCIAPEAVARALGLDFVPLASERYDLVIPQRFLEMPAIASLLDVLQTAAFRRSLSGLGGYDVSVTGQRIHPVASAFNQR